METFTLDSKLLYNQRLWWLWQIWGVHLLSPKYCLTTSSSFCEGSSGAFLFFHLCNFLPLWSSLSLNPPFNIEINSHYFGTKKTFIKVNFEYLAVVADAAYKVVHLWIHDSRLRLKLVFYFWFCRSSPSEASTWVNIGRLEFWTRSKLLLGHLKTGRTA